jgi:NAD dependent epimerase/dehydratase family enzyme
MADEALLASTRVLPEILLAEDFRPQDPTLPEALAAMLR